MPIGQAYANTELLMSMSQLVAGTALGFFLAQGVLYLIKLGRSWVQQGPGGQRLQKRASSGDAGLIGTLIRHAGLIGVSAALITLGVWAVRDFLATSSLGSTATASNFDSPGVVPLSEAQGSQEADAISAPVSRAEPVSAAEPQVVDPYRDPDFQVHRRAHGAGAPVSLKETLLQRSEAKAGAELIKETQQRAHRSQYDCEAAERAAKYIKGGLDVWGFAAWQAKYFPVRDYKGATLAQCQDIAHVLDPSWLDLASTVAQQKPAAPKPTVPRL